jgi:hypothetical protein
LFTNDFGTVSGLFLVSLLAGCANVGPLATPSGNPEVTIATKDMARVRNALLVAMSSRGYSPSQDTQNTISFTRQLDAGAAALYQLALGNAYSSTPTMNVIYTIASEGNTTRVFAFVNVSMQNAFGQVQQTNLTQAKQGVISRASWTSLRQRSRAIPQRS